MKFLWVTLRVNDLERSLDFYQNIVGLETDSRFNAGPTTEIAFLGKGETKVELLCDKSQTNMSPKEGASIGFEVENLADALKLVTEKGYDLLGDPVVANEHLSFFFIKDPDGYTVQFVENK
ncbi:MAG TPA: VOC family protein [Clostridiales bacterium]|nr:VOC family protein [Clostridiales bacterium]